VVRELLPRAAGSDEACNVTSPLVAGFRSHIRKWRVAEKRLSRVKRIWRVLRERRSLLEA
jgi:hypothetical protein